MNSDAQQDCPSKKQKNKNKTKQKQKETEFGWRFPLFYFLE